LCCSVSFSINVGKDTERYRKIEYFTTSKEKHHKYVVLFLVFLPTKKHKRGEKRPPGYTIQNTKNKIKNTAT